MTRAARLILMVTMAIPAFALALSQPSTTLAGTPGTMVWESRESDGVISRGYGVGAQGNIVVAGGEICDGPSILSCDWYVQAHDAQTGEILWTDRFDGAGSWDRTQWLVVDGGRAFFSGWTHDFAGTSFFDFMIRAYDLKNGTLLWEQRVDRNAPLEFAEIIGAHGGRVFAGGRVGGDLGSGDLGDFALLTFDARTGALLWESVTDPTGFGFTDIVYAISEHGDRVFVSGGDPGEEYVQVQAHDARTGEILWQNQIIDGFNLLYLQSLHAAHGLVYATGDINVGPGDFEAFVHAYDQITGALVWSDMLETPDAFTTGQLVTAAGSSTHVGVFECETPFVPSVSSCLWVIRSYDARTGTLEWETQLAFADASIGFTTVATHAGTVLFGGGLSINPLTSDLWTVVALDSSTGEVLWRDSSDVGAVLAIDVLGNTLFASGTLNTPDPADGFDFTVRAYALN